MKTSRTSAFPSKAVAHVDAVWVVIIIIIKDSASYTFEHSDVSTNTLARMPAKNCGGSEYRFEQSARDLCHGVGDDFGGADRLYTQLCIIADR